MQTAPGGRGDKWITQHISGLAFFAVKKVVCADREPPLGKSLPVSSLCIRNYCSPLAQAISATAQLC